MKSSLLRLFLLAFVLLGGTPASADAPAALTGPQIGQPAPAFHLRTIDGKDVSLDAYRGKTLVVNVWATWCPPCRLEMPDLIATAPKLAKAGVAVLGVDTTEEAPIVRAYVSAKGVPYPQAIDAGKTFSNAYDVQYFPTTYVIDPQGVLRARYIDVIAPAQLNALVAAANRGENGSIVSPLQAKVDATLGDSTIVFDGESAAREANAKKAEAAIAAARSCSRTATPPAVTRRICCGPALKKRPCATRRSRRSALRERHCRMRRSCRVCAAMPHSTASSGRRRSKRTMPSSRSIQERRRAQRHRDVGEPSRTAREGCRR